jgi:hypothetical protein
VAAAFATALDRSVEAVQIPQAQWTEALKKMGFSNESAVSFANMTTATLTNRFPDTDVPERGTISLQDYMMRLVEQSSK